MIRKLYRMGRPSIKEGVSFAGSVSRVRGFQPVSLATTDSIAGGSSKQAETFVGPDQVNLSQSCIRMMHTQAAATSDNPCAR